MQKRDDQSKPIRLQKFLSAAGVASRRKAEKMMLSGRVRVNGKVADQLGAHVRPGVDKVEVDGKIVGAQGPMAYLMVNKPHATITSMSDPEGRPVVTDLLPKRFPRMWPVGRLDWNSDGLLIMTNDGELTNLLTHPSSHVEKVYAVKLRGVLNHRDPGLQRVRRGVKLDDGYVTSGAQVTVERGTGKHTWVQVVLHEGRNRQIRRMCEAVGHTVLRLRRTAIGPLELERLQPGQWRSLTIDEVRALFQAAGAAPPEPLELLELTTHSRKRK